jgi:hypothetical protein
VVGLSGTGRKWKGRKNSSRFRGWAEEKSGPVFSPLTIWLSVRRFTMRRRVRKAALMALAGVLVLGLVGLVWAIETAPSKAQEDAMQNRQPAGGRAISVWIGDDGTETSQALALLDEGQAQAYDWSTVTVDAVNNVGEHASIAVDANGDLMISYSEG